MFLTPQAVKAKKKKPILVNFPVKIADRLADIASEIDKPQSQIIIDAVREYLKRLEEEYRK